MGALCGGANVPKVEVDMEAVGQSIVDALKDIPSEVAKNEAQFPHDISKADPEPFQPGDTTMKLNKESTKEDIRKAAVLSACGGKLRETVKDTVWDQIEPKLKEQIPAETPAFLSKKALEVARKPVDDAVDKAIDNVIEKLSDESAPGDNADNDAEEVDQAVKQAVDDDE
jgi:hypothetical protein